MFFVYILQSRSSSRFYIGHTDNILDRFNRHRAGRSKSTRGRGPWWMPYYEVHATRSDAATRERQLKGWKSAAAIRKLIQSSGLHVDTL
jgi:putative endonuclease